MIRIGKNLLQQLLLLLLFFLVQKVVYLLFNFRFIEDVPVASLALITGLRLDLSAAGYLLIIPLFAEFIAAVSGIKIGPFLKTYYTIVVVLLSLALAAEVPLYSEWFTKLDYKALLYLKQPSEVFSTSTVSHSFVFFLSFALQLALVLPMIFRMRRNDIPAGIKASIAIPSFIMCAGIVVVMIRGGFQPMAINQSSAYYSGHQLHNLASINSGWNLLHSISENYGLDENRYVLLEKKEAQNIVSSLIRKDDPSTEKILKPGRHNVIYIILESWSADVVASCGGDSDITPAFEKLAKEGLLFTNTYASGLRSDQGICSLMSGYPAQPTTSIINQPSKFRDLPSLPKSFKSSGYHTSFYFGGQLNYGNIEAYLFHQKMDRIIDSKSFPDSLKKAALGAHDEDAYKLWKKDLSTFPQPFFSALFTQSSHSPYDVPMQEKIKYGGIEKQYLNAVYYSDSCLSRFLKTVQAEPWYKNTLFVLVADHSKGTHRQHNFYSAEYRKIAFMLYGDVLRDEVKGQQINKIISQTDIAASVLRQLDIPSADYTWCNDIFRKSSNEFAFYSFNDGYGWITPTANYAYDHKLKTAHISKGPAEQIEEASRNGTAYLQLLMDDYLRR